MQKLATPLLIGGIHQQWRVGRTCITLAVQSVLLLIIYRLLLQAKLGRAADVIFLSEAILVLIVAPYLSVSTLTKQLQGILSDELFSLSPVRYRGVLFGSLIGSQIPTICFILLSPFVFTVFIPSVSEVPPAKVVLLRLVFGVYILSSACVGALGWRIFRNELFGTEFAHFFSLLMIGGVFLLSPLGRYADNLEPIIPPFLHINPLIAVCHLLGMDVFRTPYLYELTPIPSYLFAYPSWYIVCGWQAIIGLCCFVLASRGRRGN